MTHTIVYEADLNNNEEKILEEINKNKISLSRLEYIVDNICDSTISVEKSEVTQIVQEIFTLFREYLFTNKDFRMGWTYPKLVITNKTNLNIVIPTPKFLTQDRSFLTPEQEKYFEENEQWKLKRRGEWKLAKEKLGIFLKEEVDNFKQKLPEYTNEALCSMVVSLKYFKENFEFQKEIMKELANRREKGSDFAFEEHIKQEFLALPKATLEFDAFAEAFKGFKL